MTMLGRVALIGLFTAGLPAAVLAQTLEIGPGGVHVRPPHVDWHHEPPRHHYYDDHRPRYGRDRHVREHYSDGTHCTVHSQRVWDEHRHRWVVRRMRECD